METQTWPSRVQWSRRLDGYTLVGNILDLVGFEVLRMWSLFTFGGNIVHPFSRPNSKPSKQVTEKLAYCFLLAGYLVGLLFDPENGDSVFLRNINYVITPQMIVPIILVVFTSLSSAKGFCALRPIPRFGNLFVPFATIPGSSYVNCLDILLDSINITL